MGAFIRGCDELKRRTGATVLVVHHSGKDETKGARVPVHFVLRWMLNTGYAGGRRKRSAGYLMHQNEGRGGTQRGCL
ncbi:helicase RepA family protein [Escherichia coli]|nr:helicase RepA family protein [Escherichia coli]